MHHHPRLEIRGLTYCFRARTPADLRIVYGRKCEIRHSLRTRDKAEATRLCRLRSVEIVGEFERHRRRVSQVTGWQG